MSYGFLERFRGWYNGSFSKGRKVVVNVLVVVFFGGMVVSSVLYKQVDRRLNVSNYGYVFRVENGVGLNGLLGLLRKDGVIKTYFEEKRVLWTLRVLFLVNGFDLREIFTGEYQLLRDERSRKGDRVYDLFSILANKKLYYRKITFIEGDTAFNYKRLISGMGTFLGELKEEIKDGDILPETYSYSYGEDRNEFVRRLKKVREGVVQDLWDGSKKVDSLIKSKEDLVILASIVEKETKFEGEKSLIAGVFLNRIQKNMPLQADSTVVYEITKGEKNFGERVLFSDLKVGGDYNTYVRKGLPIGAISNPSRQTLEAVLNYRLTGFLYFVVDRDTGAHSFSETFEEHVKKAAKYRDGFEEMR